MAITNNGTVNSLSAGKVPTDYAVADASSFSDYMYVYTVTLSVLKATVDVSDPSTTMQAIIEDVTVGIDKQVDDILAADFIASRTVTAYTDWLDVTTNMTAVTRTDPFLTDAVTNYLCSVKIYIKTAA